MIPAVLTETSAYGFTPSKQGKVRDIFDLGDRLLIARIPVRVILHRQLAVRFGNLPIFSPPRNAKHFVIIAFIRHCCHG